MTIPRSTLPALAAAALAAVAAGLTVGSVAAAPVTPSPTPSTASTAPPSFASDELGYLDSAARCDRSQSLMAYGRTTRALVVICVDPSGELQYRGERLSDGASLKMPAGRATDGSIVATNDGVTYAVSPAMFLVSEGDQVLYRDSWTEFRQPRFSPGAPSPSSPSPSSPSPSSPSASPTVSTTTVTLPPKSGAPGSPSG